MNDQFQRELEIFQAALMLADAEARERYLVEACAQNEQMLQRLRSLINAHQQAGTFLLSPPGEVRTILNELPPAPEHPDGRAYDHSGERIGRYKLLQQIGEGGMGVVYMAEQLEPVHRRVALKIIK